MDVKLELEVGLSFVVRGPDFISEIAMGLSNGSGAQIVLRIALYNTYISLELYKVNPFLISSFPPYGFLRQVSIAKYFLVTSPGQ